VTDVSDENRQQQVLDYLRERFGRVDEQLSAIRDEQREQRLRLSAIERDVAGIKTDMARLDMRLDRMHDRLDRIERRLELTEEQLT
jgi:chromosome segregation ATPase